MTDEERNVNPYDDNPYEEGDPGHNAWALRHTELREHIVATANENFLKYDTTVALKMFVNDVMSSNAFMSNQTPPKRGIKRFLEGEDSFNQLEYTILSFDECMEWYLASVDPLDRNKTVVYQMAKEIENHTKNFTLTRTVGKDREGIVNRIEHSKQTQEIRSTETAEQDNIKIKKDGIF